MRPIKFRGWDEMELKWLRSFSVDPDGVVRSRAHVTGGLKMTYIDLQQFTGLLDKNGKEIYEGDIVKTADVDNSPLLVEFKDSMFGCETMQEVYYAESNPEGEERFLSLTDDSLCADYGDGDKREYALEVIGNIHENPELLSEGKGGK